MALKNFFENDTPRRLRKEVCGYRVTLTQSRYLLVADLRLPDGRGAAMGMDLALGWPTRKKLRRAQRDAHRLVTS